MATRQRWRVVSAVAISYVLLALFVRVAYRAVLYPIPKDHTALVPAGASLLTLTARDGAVVHAFEYRGQTPGRTVVYFHGNGETAADSSNHAEQLVARGLAVVTAEYRGYGISGNSGSPTEEGLYQDASAILDALDARGVHSDDVVLWGTSLGSGVAAEMAHRGRGHALVLATPYTSIPDMASKIMPILPMGLLIGDRYDTRAKCEGLRLPAFVFHGDEDELIPIRMGEAVARAIAGARFLRIAGGHHNDLFRRDGERLYDDIAAIAR